MRPYYYFGDQRGLTTLSTGQLFFVNTRARDLTPWLVHLGQWENFVDDILSALAKPNGTFLDVGANQGYYSVKIGGLTAPNGAIYAFEPNPDMFSLVSDNMYINGYDHRARVFNVAAGEASVRSTLSFQPNRPGGGHVGSQALGVGPGEARIEIDVVAIDDVLPPTCVADLIKIDVEGYEPLVLRGMARLLARSPNAAIVTEVSYPQWLRFGDPASLLREVAGDRRVFRIYVDGHIEELPSDIDQALDRDMVSYMLLLPRTDEAWAKVARFAHPSAVARPSDSSEPQPAQPASDGEPPPPRRRSLARRVAGRLMRMAFRNDP